MPSLSELRFIRRLVSNIDGVVRIQLLRTGLHAGLFEALRESRSARELAERQGLARDLVGAWLRACHAEGLVELRRDGYALRPFTRWLLDSAEAPALHALLDQVVLSYAPALERVADLMKGAERPEFGGHEENRRVAAVSRLVESRALDALARVPGAEAARRVLDIGCGYGHYLAGLLHRHRDAQGLGVELDPEVAEEARRTLIEAEVERRGEIRIGDFMTLELPSGFDLALLNNNVYYFAPNDRLSLFSRVRGCLVAGGVLAIQLPAVPESGIARRLGAASMPATFDLVLRAHRNLYGLPEVGELEEALVEAGFARTGRVPILPGGAALYVWGL